MFKVGDIVEIVRTKSTMSRSTVDLIAGSTAEITGVFQQKTCIKEDQIYYHINLLNIVHNKGKLPDLAMAEKGHWREKNFKLIEEYKPITTVSDKDVIGLFERND